MFNVIIGKEGLSNSFQDEFPETTKCVYCSGESRIGFVAKECNPPEKRAEKEFVFELHENDPKGEGYWFHDACAVAVYFCRKCFKPTAIANQG